MIDGECEKSDEPPSRNWKWQLKNRITSYEQLEKLIELTEEEKEFCNIKMPISITPYYFSLIDKKDVNDPIRKAIVPSIKEAHEFKDELIDPLHEDEQRPVKCIVHRYPDRVLFLTTDFCSVNCRYCCRSRIVSHHSRLKDDWEEGLSYIRNHVEIRDVILSGGDFLTLPTSDIDYLIGQVFAIDHIEMVRIGTKVPVVMPQRINNELIDVLKKYKPLYMSIHFMHPNEITEECAEACNKLADAGIVMGSQTVLLKGINDNADVMKSLMKKMLKIRVRPYYLYNCDKVGGTHHFRTDIDVGVGIIDKLRGWISGYGVPQFIVDSGNGKVPVNPEYYDKESGNATNYNGVEFSL